MVVSGVRFISISLYVVKNITIEMISKSKVDDLKIRV